MGTLYENIHALCVEKGIKGGKMCTDIGLSKSLMSDLKYGRKKSISAETAQKIADYFGVTVRDILNCTQQGNLMISYEGYKMGRNDERERWENGLRNGTLKEENPVTQMDDEALMFALFGDSDVITGEDLQAVKNYAAFLKEKKERGD